MLIVRREQMDALDAHARDRFIGVMTRHLTGAFPERCASLGDDRLRGLIEKGMTKADAYGLVAEQDVAGLIHFMFESHPEFDQHPAFAWAVEALSDAMREPTERVDRLFAEWAARGRSVESGG
jgi:hypothetical protein